MPLSNFPNGFANGVVVRGVPLQQTHTGQVFWVGNGTAALGGARGGSNGNNGSFIAPFSTLDYAIDQCVANRGDIIFIKPGHAETVSSAGAIALDKADVAIIGLGSGSNRPTFTLDTATTATISVSAANVSIQNCIFSANFADIVSVFTLTTAKYFALEGCRIQATATNMNFLWVVDTSTTDNAADGLLVSNCAWIEPDTATRSFLKADATQDDVVVLDSFFSLGVNNNKPAICEAATGKIMTNFRIGRCRVYRLNTDTATGGILYHTDGTTSTGMFFDNRVQHADTAAEILTTASNSIGTFENRASGVVGASGYLLPAADS
jgi:hypothetical protein